MTLEGMIEQLRPLTLRQRAKVAELGGCPYWTVQKMALGQARNPRYSTYTAIMRGLTLYAASQASPAE